MNLKLLLVAFPLALSACAVAQQPPLVDWFAKSSVEVANATVRSDSPFESSRRTEAPIVKVLNYQHGVSPPMEFFDERLIGLIGLTERSSGQTANLLQVSISYQGQDWRFYNSINLLGGEVIKPLKVERKVLRCISQYLCTYTETLIFGLPDATLRNTQTDLLLRLNANSSAPAVFTIPRNYVDGYLLALNAH